MYSKFGRRSICVKSGRWPNDHTVQLVWPEAIFLLCGGQTVYSLAPAKLHKLCMQFRVWLAGNIRKYKIYIAVRKPYKESSFPQVLAGLAPT